MHNRTWKVLQRARGTELVYKKKQKTKRRVYEKIESLVILITKTQN